MSDQLHDEAPLIDYGASLFRHGVLASTMALLNQHESVIKSIVDEHVQTLEHFRSIGTLKPALSQFNPADAIANLSRPDLDPNWLKSITPAFATRVNLDFLPTATLATQVLADFNRELSALGSVVRGIWDALKEGTREASLLIQQSASQSLDSWMQKHQETKRIAIEIFTYRCWYITGEIPMSDLRECVEAWKAQEYARVDKILCAYTNDRISEIEAVIAEQWPKRAKIINAAIEAHRQKKYALSVPVFLAQADGMAYDLWKSTNLYSKRRDSGKGPDGRPLTSKMIEDWQSMGFDLRGSLVGMFDLTYLTTQSTISYDIDIWRSHARKDRRIGTLNRHAVLHGRDCRYPSRNNSFRSLLLLDYLADVQTMIPPKGLRVKKSP